MVAAGPAWRATGGVELSLFTATKKGAADRLPPFLRFFADKREKVGDGGKTG